MITKERLEELIEQKAKIYVVNGRSWKMKEKTFHSNGNYILVDEHLEMQTLDDNKEQRINELEDVIEKLKDKIAKFYIPRYSFLDDENQLLKQENAELKQRLEKVEPKFKDKEWCYTIQDGKIWKVNVHLETNIEHIYTFVYDGKKIVDEDGFEEFIADDGIEWGDENLFKTKEEAKQKLKELEG